MELIEITAEKDFLLSELDKLNDKTRLVARLRLIGDKSFAEIANILHIPVSTARTNFKRTRDHLKSRLEDYRKL
ncbi:sigma-70 family RNA polymerase sigma factor [Clostridium sp. 19966]|nr:sigma-70 family RNA polymerase sigma factor [Clostridium sp. 19966]